MPTVKKSEIPEINVKFQENSIDVKMIMPEKISSTMLNKMFRAITKERRRCYRLLYEERRKEEWAATTESKV